MAPPTKSDQPIKASMALSEQIAVLSALISAAPETSKIIEFSPKLAEYVLTELNDKNRPMKPAKVRTYADDLEDGKWGLTGDTIKFGTDGSLKDGQNRLAASVRANLPLVTHVVFGIDPRLFARMDIGKNRNGADVFAIAGVPYANHVSVTVRWLMILTSEDPGDRGAQFSNEQLLTAYREKFDADQVERSIVAALEVRRQAHHPVGPLAALHYLFSKKDERKADTFYEEWASGRAKKARAPSRYLQSELVRISREGNNRMHENVRNAMIIKAWNAYVNGRSVSRADMRHAVSDPMPEIEGDD
jgi:hypothetical protein